MNRVEREENSSPSTPFNQLGGEGVPSHSIRLDRVETEGNFSPSTQINQVGGEGFSLSLYLEGPSRKGWVFPLVYSVLVERIEEGSFEPKKKKSRCDYKLQ